MQRGHVIEGKVGVVAWMVGGQHVNDVVWEQQQLMEWFLLYIGTLNNIIST